MGDMKISDEEKLLCAECKKILSTSETECHVGYTKK
jgi:hypothetical protein